MMPSENGPQVNKWRTSLSNPSELGNAAKEAAKVDTKSNATESAEMMHVSLSHQGA